MDPLDNVLSAKCVLFFYYKLRRFSQFHMESIGLIQAASPIPGARLSMTANPGLTQKQLLAHKGLDARYNGSLVNETSSYASTYSLENIFRSYMERNVTTELVNPLTLWTAGRAADAPFIINATINYPEQTIRYSPGFWYMMKWGWVQYSAI